MDLVADIYPDGRVVHIIRDGRDVARSLVSMAWGPQDVSAAARTWRQAVETARAHGPQMAAYVEIRYEELLANPSETFTHILKGLGLSVDAAVVEAAVLESGIPVNTDQTKPAVGTGKWRTSWSAADLAAFDAEAGELLYDELGYPRLDPSAPVPRAGLLTRARGRLRRTQPEERPAPAGHRPVKRPAAAAQLATNDLVGFLATGRLDEALSRLAPDAQVRIVTPELEWRGRGTAALDKLREVAESEGPGWGEQVRGHVYFAHPMTTTLLRYDRKGQLADRILVTRAHGDLITRLAYYRFDVPARRRPE